MTPFILICAVMTVAAIALLAVPLVRRIPSQQADTSTSKGKDKGRSTHEPDVPRSTSTFVVAAVALPLAAAAFYLGTSNFPWQNPLAASAVPAGHEQGGGDASLAEAATQLESRLAANPQDVEGWRMLGRTYLVMSQPDKAVTAYERAVAIVGAQDSDLQLDLAEALVLTDDPAAQGRAQGIIEAALKADPNNGKALWYTAVMAMRAGDTRGCQDELREAARAESATRDSPDRRRTARRSRRPGAGGRRRWYAGDVGWDGCRYG